MTANKSGYVTVTPHQDGWRVTLMSWDKYTETHKESLLGPTRRDKEEALSLAQEWARKKGIAVRV